MCRLIRRVRADAHKHRQNLCKFMYFGTINFFFLNLWDTSNLHLNYQLFNYIFVYQFITHLLHSLLMVYKLIQCLFIVYRYLYCAAYPQGIPHELLIFNLRHTREHVLFSSPTRSKGPLGNNTYQSVILRKLGLSPNKGPKKPKHTLAYLQVNASTCKHN